MSGERVRVGPEVDAEMRARERPLTEQEKQTSLEALEYLTTHKPNKDGGRESGRPDDMAHGKTDIVPEVVHCSRCGEDYNVPMCEEHIWDERKRDWIKCGKIPAIQFIEERGEINPGMMYTSKYRVCAEHAQKGSFQQDLNFGGYFDEYVRISSLGHHCSLRGRLMVRFGKIVQ